MLTEKPAYTWKKKTQGGAWLWHGGLSRAKICLDRRPDKDLGWLAEEARREMHGAVALWCEASDAAAVDYAGAAAIAAQQRYLKLWHEARKQGYTVPPAATTYLVLSRRSRDPYGRRPCR